MLLRRTVHPSLQYRRQDLRQHVQSALCGYRTLRGRRVQGCDASHPQANKQAVRRSEACTSSIDPRSRHCHRGATASRRHAAQTGSINPRIGYCCREERTRSYTALRHDPVPIRDNLCVTAGYVPRSTVQTSRCLHAIRPTACTGRTRTACRTRSPDTWRIRSTSPLDTRIRLCGAECCRRTHRSSSMDTCIVKSLGNSEG